MSSSVAEQNEKNVHSDHERVVPYDTNLPIVVGAVNMEVEEEEEEDVDFNPFLRADSPSEASSSLSSENEGQRGIVEGDFQRCLSGKGASVSSRVPAEERRGCEDEEIVMQATVHGSDEGFVRAVEKEVISLRPIRDGGGSNLMRDGTSVLEVDDVDDDDDAICKRTRARYSLANYTLEELETFLQESDNDCDHNVDDEEEYRRFLAAVLVEGEDDGKEGQGDENVDEDEDNDADFELEIEEALESDVDENVDDDRLMDGRQDGNPRIPVTRQKKRLKESVKNKRTVWGDDKMALRPLVPYGMTLQASTFPEYRWQFPSPNLSPHCSLYAAGADVNAGFTAYQIGQLYSLIHAHVQLLIQVFSVSVLDPSKQQAASGVQTLISEMISKQEHALGQRRDPYSEFCFHPSNLHFSLEFNCHRDANISYWTPLVHNPVLTLLDVAPLRLVKSFMTDISDSVLRYRQSHLECKSQLTKEPLFPLPVLESSSNADEDPSGGTTISHLNTQSAQQVSPGQAPPKKSLASMIVESTMKHSVALVPIGIARSAQRFYPLFNPALFPHKPPASSVANRILFTDAEDGLLAMGLMQYNNDWGTIQQHFLPCKSTHQIFVRQKNRSSSKAPENPIKAVRRIKTSPLTTNEKAQINEGLKLFKNDWLLVWKFVVPQRDPFLLPRLWRIANGTQRSYKKSEAMKEKRRLYEAKRRKMKASIDDCQTSSDKEVDTRDNTDVHVNCDDEAYVHEAFLQDSELGISKHLSCDAPRLPYNDNSICQTSTSVLNGNEKLCQESGHRFQNLPFQDLRSPSHCSQAISASKQLASHLCQPQKSKGARVVKLAPDLPAVNLPPSVRVISESDFKNYHRETAASVFSDNTAGDHVSTVTQSARVGCNIFNPSRPLYKISDQGQDTGRQQCEEEENASESDLQMHPLLFQAPEYQPSYFSINFDSADSTLRNSFLRDPCQVEPGQCSERSYCHSNVTQPEKAPADLCTIDFHPLLQRGNNESGESSTRTSLSLQSGDLKASKGNFSELFNHSDRTLRNPTVGNDQVATSIASPTHTENENNLDLDIRLCSGPDKEKSLGREHHKAMDPPTVLNNRMVGKELCGDASFVNCTGKCSEALATRNLSLQVVPACTSSRCQCKGDIHDACTSGIVMEQEELSDSDEEIEHVEFECEEIDDSEEEDEMGTVPHFGVQNKEFPFFTSKEEEIEANRSLQARNYEKNGSVGKCEQPVRADVLQFQHGQSSKKKSSNSKVQQPPTKRPRKRPMRASPASSLF